MSPLACWLQSGRLLFAFLMTAGLGIHAYYQHKLETVQAVSPRKWMFWMYSAVFLMVSIVYFAQFCIAQVFRDYEKTAFHLGFLTFLLALSYLALVSGVKRRPLE